MSQRPLILLVDDEISLQLTLGLILKRAGYPIWTATLSNEAVEIPGFEHFNLVFIDLHAPEECGFQVLQKIREKCPELPVVMLIPSNNVAFRKKAARYGSVTFITKPIDPEEILKCVGELVGECHAP